MSSYRDIAAILRSDVDDETVVLSSAHSEQKIYSYIDRALTETNNRLKLAVKEAYIKYQRYIDIYNLPDDFIEAKLLSDCKDNKIVGYQPFDLLSTQYKNSIMKNEGRPYAYAIDESGQRKITMNLIPDKVPVEAYLVNRYTAGDDYMVLYADDMGEWFDPPVVMLDTNSQYVRISKVQSITAITGNGLLSVSGVSGSMQTATTATAWGGFLQAGDYVTAGGQVLLVTAVNSITGITFAVAATADVASATYLVNPQTSSMKKLWISQNTLTEVPDTTVGYGDQVNLQDLVLSYVYQPSNVLERGAGALSASETSVTASPTGVGFNGKLVVGDILSVGTEHRTVLVTNGVTAQIDSAFDAAITASNYYILHRDNVPPIPINRHNFITMLAKQYALENESRMQEAMAQARLYEEQLNKVRESENSERCGRYNNSLGLPESQIGRWR